MSGRLWIFCAEIQALARTVTIYSFMSAAAFGSQGQQRSAALALKLAQLEYVKNNTGEYPVLLLDDVMSELDSERRTHLLKFIDGRVQTFITVNDKHLIPDLNNNAYFYIENGKVMQG